MGRDRAVKKYQKQHAFLRLQCHTAPYYSNPDLQAGIILQECTQTYDHTTRLETVSAASWTGWLTNKSSSQFTRMQEDTKMWQQNGNPEYQLGGQHS